MRKTYRLLLLALVSTLPSVAWLTCAAVLEARPHRVMPCSAPPPGLGLSGKSHIELDGKTPPAIDSPQMRGEAFVQTRSPEGTLVRIPVKLTRAIYRVRVVRNQYHNLRDREERLCLNELRGSLGATTYTWSFWSFLSLYNFQLVQTRHEETFLVATAGGLLHISNVSHPRSRQSALEGYQNRSDGVSMIAIGYLPDVTAPPPRGVARQFIPYEVSSLEPRGAGLTIRFKSWLPLWTATIVTGKTEWHRYFPLKWHWAAGLWVLMVLGLFLWERRRRSS